MSDEVFTDMLEDEPEQNWHCRICGALHIGTHDLPLGELCEGCSDQPATAPSATPRTDAFSSLQRTHREWIGHSSILERELADATKQRDEWFSVATLKTRQLGDLREQRDALAGALREIASGAHGWVECVDRIAQDALAALEEHQTPPEQEDPIDTAARQLGKSRESVMLAFRFIERFKNSNDWNTDEARAFHRSLVEESASTTPPADA